MCFNTLHILKFHLKLNHKSEVCSYSKNVPDVIWDALKFKCGDVGRCAAITGV